MSAVTKNTAAITYRLATKCLRPTPSTTRPIGPPLSRVGCASQQGPCLHASTCIGSSSARNDATIGSCDRCQVRTACTQPGRGQQPVRVFQSSDDGSETRLTRRNDVTVDHDGRNLARADNRATGRDDHNQERRIGSRERAESVMSRPPVFPCRRRYSRSTPRAPTPRGATRGAARRPRPLCLVALMIRDIDAFDLSAANGERASANSATSRIRRVRSICRQRWIT